MADPLSIAASIAGLATMAGSVFLSLIEYTKSVKDAKNMVSNLATEMRNLSGLLQNLSLLTGELEKRGMKPVVAFQKSQVALWKETISKIEKKVDKANKDFHGSSFESRLRLLKWPFSRDETECLLAELNRHKATIHLALAVDNLDKLVECLGLQKKTLSDIDQVRDSLKKLGDIQRRFEIDQKKKQVRDFFQSVNPQPSLQSSINLRHQKTGTWLLESHAFVSWKTTENSKLWLSGIPGSGKTVMCGSIIEEVLQECSDNIAISFFFCDYKTPQSQQLTAILSSIAAQLALQKVDAFSLLEEYFDDLNPENGLKKAPESGALSSLILRMVSLFAKVFLVIDGLDECANNTCEVVRGVKELAQGSNLISTAFLSRNEVIIHEELIDSFQHIEIAAQTEDLELFVGAEMTNPKRKQLNSLDPALAKDIRHALVSGAQGMFRWVACQLDYLAGLPNSLRRQALKRLPPTLNGTYDRILEQILDNSIDASISDIIQKALHWICYAENDLKISQLCEAVSIQDGKDSLDGDDLIEESDIARYCSSLIRKSYDGRCFELAHFTVKEYLLKIDPTSKLKTFRYSPDDASESLTAISLRFLMFPTFRHQPVPDASELDRMSKRAEMHPFYWYATTFWPNQYRVHDKQEIQQLIKDLFGTRKKHFFQNWLIEYLSYLRNNHWGSDLRDSFSKTILFAIRQDLSPLHVAASLGLSGICKWLLEVSESANAKSRVGTPLHCALAGPLIFGTTHDIRSIRHLHNSAVPSSHLGKTIQLLLEHGADVDSTWAGIGVASWALDVCVSMKCANPFIPILHRLTSFETDTTERIQDLSLRYSDQNFMHDIFQAVLDMEPNSTDNPSLSRLLSTVKTKIRDLGHWEEYEHTNEEFSIATVPSEDFHQLVKSAAYRDDANEMAAFLADPRFEDLGLRSETSAESPLHYAVQEASCDTIDVLLKSKFDFNFADVDGDLPLHLCEDDFQIEALRMLLKNGFSSEEVDADGDTLWHRAAARDSTEILKILLQVDGNVTGALKRCSNFGRTPLTEALSHSRKRAACLLLEYCSNDPEFFHSDIPPAHLAAAIGSESLFESLLAKHQSVTDFTPGGSTPLHYINSTIEPGLLQFLIKIYKVEHTRRDGKTAFEVYFEGIDNSHIHRQPRIPPQSVAEALLPPSHKLGTSSRSQHVWEFFCWEILTTRNQPRRGDTFYQDRSRLAPYVLASLIKKDVLSSYEELKDHSATIPLFRSLAKMPYGVLRQEWIATLIETILIGTQQSRSKDPIKSPVAVALFKKSIQNDAMPLIKLFLRKDVSVHSSESNVSVIEHACEHGTLETFQLLFSCHDPSLLNNIGDSGVGLIHRLTTSEEVFASKIEHALECGLDPNTKSSTISGQSVAIVMAAGRARWEVVDLLLDHGADLYAVDGYGFDVAKAAARYGQENYIRQIQAGTKRAKYDWNSTALMHFATKSGKQIRSNSCHLLHFAAHTGQTKLLRYLLKEGIIDNNIDCRSAEQFTPLHLASFGGHVETIQFLVESGADVNALDIKNNRAIDIAFMENALDVVRSLLRLNSEKPSNEEWADMCLLEIASDEPGLARRDMLLDTSTANQLWYFESAIVSGNLEVCQRMIARGCSVEDPLPTCHGCHALTRAVRAGQLDIVMWLLEQGARPGETRCPRVHPAEWGTIHATVKNPKLSEACLVKLLDSALENGYDWSNNRNQINPIHIATFWNNTVALHILVDHLNENADRYKALEAIRMIHYEGEEDRECSTLSLLLNQRMGRISQELLHLKFRDWKFLDYFAGATLLHWAASNDRSEIATFLLENGAIIERDDGFGRTSLSYAARQNSNETTRVLLDHGAYINHQDFRGYTPLMIAVERGFEDLAKLLIHRGARLDLHLHEGQNLLYLAILGKSIELFRFFLDRGIDPYQTNSFGRSPVSLALLQGGPNFVSCILHSRLLAKAPHSSPNFLLAAIWRDRRPLSHICKSLPSALALKHLNTLIDGAASLLCITARFQSKGVVEKLLDLGADMEMEGSEDGTALMTACAGGQLEIVQLLVRRGARVHYVNEHGISRSAIDAARYYPNIRKWLLSSRFHCQPMLTSTAFSLDLELKPWSGLQIFKYKLEKVETQFWGETMTDYVIYVTRLKKSLLGRVVGLRAGSRALGLTM